MRFDPDKRHRRSIRLRDHDYSQAGVYFVTICAHQKECLFGEISQGEAILSAAGQVVQQVWEDLPSRFPCCNLDAFVVMPNHVHGIILITRADMGEGIGGDVGASEGAASSAPTGETGDVGALLAAPSDAPSLGDIIRAFKSISAIQVNRLLARSGQPLWQRNYYERIIRDEDELNSIRQYIISNPAQWAIDQENPTTFDTPT